MIKSILNKFTSNILNKASFMMPALMVFSAQASVLISSRFTDMNVKGLATMIVVKAIILPQLSKLEVIQKMKQFMKDFALRLGKTNSATT